jgi:hypothetical protein
MTENHADFVTSQSQQIPVVAKSDVVVVGAGPAGLSAAISAARNGCSVTLIERYHHLGGMASGGMVLVLDDMVNNGNEVVTTGVVSEFVDRMARQDGAVFPPPEDCQRNWDMWKKWSRWGCINFHETGMPQSILHAVAFDPDAWKRVSLDLVREAGVNLRLHSWFSEAIVEGNRVTGVICQTKVGRQAIMADMVIDATGDLDLASSAGAEFTLGQSLMSDLKSSGLLSKTLVVVLSEFGRTPRINDGGGRDHWARVFSAFMAGGGVKGGTIVGASDEDGMDPAEREVKTFDLHATVCQALGISLNKELYTHDGRPMRLVRKDGQPIEELFG